MKRFPCPKCARSLEPSGVMSLGGAELPVYQCDECLHKVEFMGEEIELPLTFAVGADGVPFDPADAAGPPDDDRAADDSE